MTRKILTAASVAIACVSGIAVGQLICNTVSGRDAIGVLLGRGHLLASIHGNGIYESDLRRKIEELRYANGDKDVDLVGEDSNRAVISCLIADLALEQMVERTPWEANEVFQAAADRECNLVRFQFRDTGTWLAALATDHLSRQRLRGHIAANLRALPWLDRQLFDAIKVTDSECAEYFSAHQPLYSLPVRYRASHLFLAAPTETPAPIVDLKCRTIDSLSLRISHGENFSELVAIASEDEFTKKRGGDLGFFSEWRMPSDFFAAVAQMRGGEIGSPIRTGLGFHILQLTDAKQAHQLSLEEAKPEIRLKLENEKRRVATERLTRELAGDAEFISAR